RGHGFHALLVHHRDQADHGQQQLTGGKTPHGRMQYGNQDSGGEGEPLWKRRPKSILAHPENHSNGRRADEETSGISLIRLSPQKHSRRNMRFSFSGPAYSVCRSYLFIDTALSLIGSWFPFH